jgi:hypothetical protein
MDMFGGPKAARPRPLPSPGTRGRAAMWRDCSIHLWQAGTSSTGRPPIRHGLQLEHWFVWKITQISFDKYFI